MLPIGALALGLLATCVWLARALDSARGRLASLTASEAAARATLEAERRAHLDRESLVADSEERLSDRFAALAAQALHENSEQLAAQARVSLAAESRATRMALEERQRAIADLLAPLSRTLDELGGRLCDVDRARAVTEARLAASLAGVSAGQGELKNATEGLVRALRQPSVRGRWGEVQLRRVIELAGMLDHCDFDEQTVLVAGEQRLRPDLVVHLPGGRDVVVDAKTPILAFLEALEATDERAHNEALRTHARQVRDHVERLSARSYFSALPRTPEFVVLFVPSDAILGAALEADPALIEHAASRRIVLATPMTLVATLWAVAQAWSEHAIAENALQIHRLGGELHDRLRVLAEHWTDLRQGLERAVNAYNSATGSLESRVLPAARKLKELGAGGPEEIEVAEPVEVTPRPHIASVAC
jgi:DNA recombination protein RmuC